VDIDVLFASNRLKQADKSLLRSTVPVSAPLRKSYPSFKGEVVSGAQT
jgi:hypothetical protein